MKATKPTSEDTRTLASSLSLGGLPLFVGALDDIAKLQCFDWPRRGVI